jgi:hypothetical protein
MEKQENRILNHKSDAKKMEKEMNGFLGIFCDKQKN